jgi:hypothetical protein
VNRLVPLPFLVEEIEVRGFRLFDAECFSHLDCFLNSGVKRFAF